MSSLSISYLAASQGRRALRKSSSGNDCDDSQISHNILDNLYILDLLIFFGLALLRTHVRRALRKSSWGNDCDDCLRFVKRVPPM